MKPGDRVLYCYQSPPRDFPAVVTVVNPDGTVNVDVEHNDQKHPKENVLVWVEGPLPFEPANFRPPYVKSI